MEGRTSCSSTSVVGHPHCRNGTALNTNGQSGRGQRPAGKLALRSGECGRRRLGGGRNPPRSAGLRPACQTPSFGCRTHAILPAGGRHRAYHTSRDPGRDGRGDFDVRVAVVAIRCSAKRRGRADGGKLRSLHQRGPPLCCLPLECGTNSRRGTFIFIVSIPAGRERDVVMTRWMSQNCHTLQRICNTIATSPQHVPDILVCTASRIARQGNAAANR